MVLTPPGQLSPEMQRLLVAGRQLGKSYMAKLAAAEAEPAYALEGPLFVTGEGDAAWGMVAVPNAMVRGVFQAMNEPGVEIPTSGPDGRLNAHIEVFSASDLRKIGGPAKLTERGKNYRYSLGRLVTYEPDGWPGIARCWSIIVHSQELQALRRSYGLTSLLRDGTVAFHITVACRKHKVLGRNDASKS